MNNLHPPVDMANDRKAGCAILLTAIPMMQEDVDPSVSHGIGLHTAPSPLAMPPPRLARIAMAGPLVRAAPAQQNMLVSRPQAWPAAVQGGAGRGAAPEPLLPVSLLAAPLDTSLLSRHVARCFVISNKNRTCPDI